MNWSNPRVPLTLSLFITLGFSPASVRAQQDKPSKPESAGWTSSWTQPANEQQRKIRDFTNQFDQLFAAKRYPAALQMGNQGIKDFPDDTRPYHGRALVLIQLGRFDPALQDIDAGDRLTEQNHDIAGQAVFMRLRADVHAHQKNYPAAAEDLRTAVKLNPAESGGLNALAWLRATCPVPALRDGREGVKLAQKALALHPIHPYTVLDTLAAAYAESNDYPHAVESEKDALADAQKEAAKNAHAMKFLKDAPARLQLFEQGQPYHHDTFAE